MKLLIINGPNLNLLGNREPEVYGDQGFEAYYSKLNEKHTDTILDYFQSNHEGEIIDKLHAADNEYDGVILNAGGYTHTSVAIADAIKAISVIVIEVHISNTAAREPFRHHSYLTPVCKGVIAGFGMDSYDLAIQSFLK